MDNEANIATGWMPGELSLRGRGECAQLRHQIAPTTFDGVFTSDLARSIMSAQIIFEPAYSIEIDSRLRECDYGAMTGAAASEVFSCIHNHVEEPFPGGESLLDVQERVASFVEGLREGGAPGSNIAIVGHQGTQLALEVLLNGKSWAEALSEDWRGSGRWRPGWPYHVQDEP
ncbi:histidine phosphatase family protein [Micromonospora sp. NPDC005205]|uniref:histidine phosphatase family protein n=1 Tax=Micromonospora sp. NPDC005205 TaxID=3156714 RepID=UPI0033AFC212